MSIASTTVLGSDLFTVSTTQEHELGTRAVFQIKDSSGNPASCEAVYCKSLATLSANYLTEVPLVRGTDAFQIDAHVTTTTAAAIADTVGDKFLAGVPLVASVSGDYLWVAVKGLIPLFAGASCAVGATVHTTATAGLVDDAVTTHEVRGVAPLATVGGSNAVTDSYAFHDIFVVKIS